MSQLEPSAASSSFSSSSCSFPSSFSYSSFSSSSFSSSSFSSFPSSFSSSSFSSFSSSLFLLFLLFLLLFLLLLFPLLRNFPSSPPLFYFFHLYYHLCPHLAFFYPSSGPLFCCCPHFSFSTLPLSPLFLYTIISSTDFPPYFFTPLFPPSFLLLPSFCVLFLHLLSLPFIILPLRSLSES